MILEVPEFSISKSGRTFHKETNIKFLNFKPNEQTTPDNRLLDSGVVGKGLWDVLEQTPGLKATIRQICIKRPSQARPIPAGHFTFDRNILLN